MSRAFTDDEIDDIFHAWPELADLEGWSKEQVRRKAYRLGLRHTPQEVARRRKRGFRQLQKRWKRDDAIHAEKGIKEFRVGPKSSKAEIDQAAASTARVYGEGAK